MNARKIGTALAAALIGCAVGMASAKLPAPTEEQKAKGAEAKAKAAEAAKKDAELLGKSQDRAVENYKRTKVQKTAAPVSGKR
jgi:hypothetical protein